MREGGREGKEAAKRGPGTHDCEREEREATFKTRRRLEALTRLADIDSSHVFVA